MARHTAALARLQHELAAQPGVAEIAGPASLPGPAQLDLAQFNPMLAASGGAARFVVVENTDPLDATAINRIQRLQHDLPALGRAAGLRGARFELAGQTALAGDSIGSVFADLSRVALAIMAVTLVLLALFLRSLLAPVYLLAASVLAVFATLGLAIVIGQHLFGYASLVYFVPFAAGVLAVIPLEQFRQIAIAMALGVVLDAIAVRSLLVPALVALFGRLGMWPGNRRARPEPAPAAAPAPVRAGDQP